MLCPIFPSYKNINCCKGETSDIFFHNTCEKWCKSNVHVDSKKSQRTYIFKITKVSKNQLHQNVWMISYDELKIGRFAIIDSRFFNKHKTQKYLHLGISNWSFLVFPWIRVCPILKFCILYKMFLWGTGLKYVA